MNENIEKIKIVFMGTPTFAARILRILAEEKYNITTVITRPDKKIGRKQEVVKSAVKIAAEELRVPVFTPDAFDNETVNRIKSLSPDMIIVVSYGKILPGKILKIPKYGSINVHASLLPKYRGPSPIQNALLQGEKETGISIMLMDEGVDTGNILSRRKINIDVDEKYPELLGRLTDLAARLLLETIPQWMNGKIEPTIQDNSQTSICQLIDREDGKITWTDSANDIYNRYRAFTPWPGIFSFWKKNNSYLRIKFNKINVIREKNKEVHHPGEVFSYNGGAAIQTGDGSIVLEELQVEGKSNIKIGDFLNGNPQFLGAVLK